MIFRLSSFLVKSGEEEFFVVLGWHILRWYRRLPYLAKCELLFFLSRGEDEFLLFLILFQIGTPVADTVNLAWQKASKACVQNATHSSF